MALYKNRDRFGSFSVRVGILFSKLGLSPNQWTVFSLIPAFVAVWFLMQEDFLIAALLFIVSAFMDLIDGSVARVTGRVTKFGAYLDTVVDRYVEGIIVFGLLFVPLPGLLNIPAYAWIFLYFFGGLMTTYVKAAAKEKELVEKEIRGGILERAERMLFLFVGILAAHFNPLYLTYILAVLAFFANLTALQRIWVAYRSSRSR